jgi:hypothetical protein
MKCGHLLRGMDGLARRVKKGHLNTRRVGRTSQIQGEILAECATRPGLPDVVWQVRNVKQGLVLYWRPVEHTMAVRRHKHCEGQ